jgi:hypothetical protein
MADRQFLEALYRRLADEGQLIEAGWIGLRLAAVPHDASAIQLDNMRMAFMAGAHHLFTSIMKMLEPGTEETEADLRRIVLIDEELRKFGEELELRVGRPKGSA